MPPFLYFISVISFFVGVYYSANAKNAMHQVDSSILFLICVVSMSGAAIISAINNLTEETAKSRELVKIEDEKQTEKNKDYSNS